jgi:hypothetical protein
VTPGKYQDDAMEIEGACAPVIIHCDATQTEEKKLEERERQRNGEAPSESKVNAKFRKGMDIPEVLVRTSKSGSMTQEIFFDYCKHFVASLKEDHEPVILFLDGHASRWNTQALKYLYQNKVFVFFFASHTSIWAQPNDCGLNKRVHWAIEQACKKFRRSGRTTTTGYFNEIFSMGWRIFLNAERKDLLECFENNATRAYERTGVWPLDPFAEAWMGAIDGLGVANAECTTVSYEIVPAEEKMPNLTPEEKKLLRTDLDLDDQNDLGDFYCAEIQSTKILGKWWGDVEKGVSEGNEVSDYSKLHLPASFATTECEKFVVTLIHFEPIDVSKIPLPAKKSTEERGKEISKTIVELTGIAQPIHISYLFDEESTNDTGPLDSSMDDVCYWLEGTAIKRKNATWSLTLVNGDIMTRTSEEMLASPKIYIQNAYTELNANERKRTISKKKRIQKTDKKKREKECIKLAKEKQEEEERKEFDNMMESVEGGGFGFSDFKALVTRMREPFSCEIDGAHVQVTPDDAAIMFDNAALKAIKRVLVLDGPEKDNEGGDGPPRKKRRNTAAAETGLGLGCNKAHYQTDRRDRTQNANNKANQLKQDLKEKDILQNLLTVFDDRKKPYMEAMRAWRERGAHAPCPHLPFWVCRASDKGAFRLFLRMFLPKYGFGFLGKPPAEQWVIIQDKITGTLDLTESSVNAKAEELRRRLRTVEQSIEDSQAVQGDQ